MLPWGVSSGAGLLSGLHSALDPESVGRTRFRRLPVSHGSGEICRNVGVRTCAGWQAARQGADRFVADARTLPLEAATPGPCLAPPGPH